MSEQSVGRPGRRDLLKSAALLTALTGAAAGASEASAQASRAGTPSPASPSVRVPGAQPTADTQYGKIRGFTQGNVAVYLGVPYGASTHGEARFMPPRAPQPWTGLKDCLNFGPQCPDGPPKFVEPGVIQFGNEGSFVLYRNWTPHISGEDCLKLNVWAPARAGKRPVMVYMHGGGYFTGSGNDLLAYDGRNLADRGDVVVVTHNHRLNVFGYLDLSSFGGKYADCVNVGMQDILAVLRWVRDNAASFGGDPGNVTIFGQSGGGGKVSTLLAMPAAKGLFHKAIVESGSPGAGPEATPQSKATQAAAALKELGLDRGSIDKLHTLKGEEIARLNDVRSLGGWGPVVDGKWLPVKQGEPTAASQGGSGVPLIVGTCLNEASAAMDNPAAAAFTEANLREEAVKAYGPSGADIAAAYRRSYPKLTPAEVWSAVRASGTRSSALRQAANKTASGGKAWEYVFAWTSPVLGGRGGTYHSCEIVYAFNNADLCVNQTGGGPDAMAVAAQVSGAWAAFAHTGDPNHPGLPRWPAYGEGGGAMYFDAPSRVVLQPEAEGLGLIAKAGPAQPPRR